MCIRIFIYIYIYVYIYVYIYLHFRMFVTEASNAAPRASISSLFIKPVYLGAVARAESLVPVCVCARACVFFPGEKKHRELSNVKKRNSILPRRPFDQCKVHRTSRYTIGKIIADGSKLRGVLDFYITRRICRLPSFSQLPVSMLNFNCSWTADLSRLSR
jgi:hypothetical protein